MITRLARSLTTGLICLVLAGCGEEASNGNTGRSNPTSPTPRTSAALAADTPTESPPSDKSRVQDSDTGVVRISLPEGITEVATVSRIVDGDTINVEFANGETERVRLLAIDAPEVADCFGTESQIGLSEILPVGSDVWLQRVDRDRDQYGRLLRHVWHFDRSKYRLIEYEVVEQGYAFSHDYGDRSLFTGKVERAMSVAERDGLGLWSACNANQAQIDPVQVDNDAIGIAAGSQECSPSYPGVCIPPAPPDLDCGDITFRRFQVLQPDPHNFDSDRDGQGCESG